MKLQIVVNVTFEEEKALIDVSSKKPKLIIKGDQYHDKINEFIKGYLFCLDQNKIQYVMEEKINILPEDRDTYFDDAIVNKELFFDICDFYDEEN